MRYGTCLGFIVDEHLAFPLQISSVFVNFFVSILTLIPQQPVGLPQPSPSFTPNLITVIVFTTAFLGLKQPACNRFRTPLHTLLLKLLNLVTPHLEVPLLQKVFTTTQPSHLRKLISVQSPCNTRSLSLVTLAHPTSSSLRITDWSFRRASPCLWNQLPSSLRQPHPNFSIYSSLPTPVISSSSVDSPLLPSVTTSLFHSQLKTDLIHKSFSLPPSGLTPRTLTQTISSELYRFFVLVLFLIFLFWFRAMDSAGYTRQVMSVR